jgi:hypothetical protein
VRVLTMRPCGATGYPDEAFATDTVRAARDPSDPSDRRVRCVGFDD